MDFFFGTPRTMFSTGVIRPSGNLLRKGIFSKIYGCFA